MKYYSEIHHRHSIRLRGYDYSIAGSYFVTICTHHHVCVLVNIGDDIVLTEAGHIVQQCWDDLPNHYPNVLLDAFVIMPNHVHGIMHLIDDSVGAGLVGAGFKPAPTKRHGLPEIMRGFKTFSARHINQSQNTSGVPFWQRTYYDHIIRNEKDLQRIRRYIELNPSKWVEDSLYAAYD